MIESQSTSGGKYSEPKQDPDGANDKQEREHGYYGANTACSIFVFLVRIEIANSRPDFVLINSLLFLHLSLHLPRAAIRRDAGPGYRCAACQFQRGAQKGHMSLGSTAIPEVPRCEC